MKILKMKMILWKTAIMMMMIMTPQSRMKTQLLKIKMILKLLIRKMKTGTMTIWRMGMVKQTLVLRTTERKWA